jgi:hypothetical protein
MAVRASGPSKWGTHRYACHVAGMVRAACHVALVVSRCLPDAPHAVCCATGARGCTRSSRNSSSSSSKRGHGRPRRKEPAGQTQVGGQSMAVSLGTVRCMHAPRHAVESDATRVIIRSSSGSGSSSSAAIFLYNSLHGLVRQVLAPAGSSSSCVLRLRHQAHRHVQGLARQVRNVAVCCKNCGISVACCMRRRLVACCMQLRLVASHAIAACCIIIERNATQALRLSPCAGNRRGTLLRSLGLAALQHSAHPCARCNMLRCGLPHAVACFCQAGVRRTCYRLANSPQRTRRLAAL